MKSLKSIKKTDKLDSWNKILNSKPSPLQVLDAQRWAEKGVQLFIKRDDLLAPSVDDPFCGNKWRKLKYNLLYAKEHNYSTLLSFGGAYSNHIAALASAGQHFGFQTVGIIRGETVNNPTISKARNNGMQLHFVDRSTYRRKNKEGYLKELKEEYGSNCYIIPEGGTNELALKGATELAIEIENQTQATHIATACGTGGTLAGIIQGIKDNSKAIGISVLKGDFMTKEVVTLLNNQPFERSGSWEVMEKFHHGGYARKSGTLLTFIDQFETEHAIALEPVYTGKLFYALDQMLENGYFPRGSKVVGIHTGGLQGKS